MLKIAPEDRSILMLVLDQGALPIMMGIKARLFGPLEQVNIGLRFGGGRHLVDVLAQDPAGVQYLISMKWQQTSGTAEQKVPYEAMCLAEVVRTSTVPTRAYIVLGGTGWTLRDFYTSGRLRDHLTHGDLVTVLTLEAFVVRANSGRL